MIVVLIHDPQTGQANMSFEGGQPEQVHELLYNMTDMLGQQLGKPPLKKKTNLVIPNGVLPPTSPNQTYRSR